MESQPFSSVAAIFLLIILLILSCNTVSHGIWEIKMCMFTPTHLGDSFVYLTKEAVTHESLYCNIFKFQIFNISDPISL